MQEGVSAARQLAEPLHQGFHIASLKHLGQIIDHPDQPVIQIIGHIAKQLAQEGVGFGQKAARLIPAEILQRGVMEPRREHAIGDGFGVHAREILDRDVVDQLVAKRLILARQIGLVIVVGDEGTGQDILDQRGLARHQLGQNLGLGDGDRRLGREFPERGVERAKPVGVGANAHQDLADPDIIDQPGIAVEQELQPIGVDQVRQRLEITLALFLFAVLEVSQVRADDLGLGIADQHIATQKREIGRTHIGSACRLIDHRQRRINPPEERFQREAIGKLGRLVRRVEAIQLVEIG